MDERAEAANLQAIQDEMNPILNAFVHTGAFMTGVGTAVWDGVKFVKEVSDLANPIVTLSNATKSAWLAYKGDHNKPFAQEFLKNFSEEQKDEFIDVLGFDPTKVTREQIAEAYEITTSVMDDPASRQLLADFAVDYAKAQDSTELAKFGGGVAFEVILAAVIAALTGGVGLAVVAGKSIKNVKHLKKLGDLFIKLSKKLRQLKIKRKNSGSTNSKIDTKAKIADEVDVKKVFHTVTNPAAAQGVLKGVDPRFLNPDSRFGKAFYIADDAPTTVKELAHHGYEGTHTIRYDLNHDKAKILDFTDPDVAKKWGYTGGDITPETKALGVKAVESGYNTIKFPSMRGEGNNFAVLSDFNEILTPQMVVPTK